MPKTGRTLFYGLMLLILIFSSGCSRLPDAETVAEPENLPTVVVDGAAEEFTEVEMTIELIKADVPFENPDLGPQDFKPLVQANNRFAFDFYRETVKNNATVNAVVSPYSIALALAMAAGGAEGETALEMAEVLNYSVVDGDPGSLWQGLAAWIDAYADSPDELEPGFDLSVQNAAWVQAGFPIEEDYLNDLARHYDSGLYLADYINHPEESRLLINDWVKKETKDRITDLIPEGAIHPLTRLALINTIYFNAPWRFPFNPENTKNEEFHLLDGSTIPVPMMQQTLHAAYQDQKDYLLVRLPYTTGKVEMILVSPKESNLIDFENRFNTADLEAVIENAVFGEVKLFIPKFKFSTSLDLKQTLSDLGMPTAFNRAAADFSGISREEELFIDAVLHKAYIDVNEEGTEAAAATAILLAGKGMPNPDPLELRFENPFLFFIRDQETGSILFYGRVVDPTQEGES